MRMGLKHLLILSNYKLLVALGKVGLYPAVM